jgi:hypothetical protein
MSVVMLRQEDTQAINNDSPNFDDFYLLYPRHEARKDALKAWTAMSESDRLAATVAIVAWRPLFLRRETQHIPLPATWLRGERWTDELPCAAATTASHASHVAVAAATTSGPRAAIPDHVRAVIEKLRAK